MRFITKPWTAAAIVSVLAFSPVLVADAAIAGPNAASKDKAATLTGTSDGYPTTTISGTFEGKFGEGTYSGTLTLGPIYLNPDDLCYGPVCQDVEGTITFSSKGGDITADVEPGGVVGTSGTPHFSQQVYDLTLKIESGERGQGREKGQLTLSYSSNTYLDDFGEIVSVEDSGTLVGSR